MPGRTDKMHKGTYNHVCLEGKAGGVGGVFLIFSPRVPKNFPFEFFPQGPKWVGGTNIHGITAWRQKV